MNVNTNEQAKAAFAVMYAHGVSMGEKLPTWEGLPSDIQFALVEVFNKTQPADSLELTLASFAKALTDRGWTGGRFDEAAKTFVYCIDPIPVGVKAEFAGALACVEVLKRS